MMTLRSTRTAGPLRQFHLHSIRFWLALASITFLAVTTLHAQTPAQTCTSQDIRGNPISGVVCGGSTHALSCSPGALYRCKSGSVGQTNNCSLMQACNPGCITGPTTGTLSDKCFTGAKPLSVSTNSIVGGNDLTFTAILQATHTAPAEINLSVNRGDLVPGQYCGVPDLQPGQTTATWGLPTAVVTSPVSVRIYDNIAYADASGVSRQLVSTPAIVTLNPGGTEPPTPPLASFTLSPSTIAPGGYSFMDATLTKFAPARGVNVSVASSNAAVASVIPAGQPMILGGCTTGGGAATIQAAASVPQQTTLTISASSGATGQQPLTEPLVVTAGCRPKSCVDVTACGAVPDGCGGTISCGCANGGTCNAGQCEAPPPSASVASLSLNPTSVRGGSSSIATVTLTQAAPPGGTAAFLSTSSNAARIPGSVVIPEGQVSANFTVTTTTVSSNTSATISATLNGGTGTAVLTITR
jgi:hypothetical protein